MKNEKFKTSILLITYALVLAFFLINIKEIGLFIGKILTILMPLWIGIAIAFILNVPMSIIETKLFGKTNKKIKVVSLILSILMVALLLLILFAWVIPDFISSATYLLGQIPSLLAKLNNLLIDLFKNTELSSYLSNFTGNTEITQLISTIFKNMINNFTSTLSNFVTLIINLFTGTIIAVYFLLEKEKIIYKLKLIMNKILDTKLAKKVDKVFKLANKSFHDFITYQCLECLILGILMFIAFSIFRFPYALTIAFLTTVTAIIPIFGATIACIVGIILIGTKSINQAILFLIVFQVIQQIEGNLIYPKVVGKNVGLPPVLTIIALMIGGKVAGFFGMIICIPITSIIYSLICTGFFKDVPKIKISEVKEQKN